MLRKVDGSQGGFAFVDSASRNEMVLVFEAVSSTHLYVLHVKVEFTDRI